MNVRVLVPWALVACVGALGCGGDDAGDAGGGDEYDYVVELPPVAGGRDDPSDADGGGDTGGDGDGDGDADADDGAEQVLREADIVQLADDRLYALSRHGSLAVVDAADPADLRLLGRYRTHAEPFEMYLEQGVAFIMYRGWGRHVPDPELGSVWRSSSYMAAVEVSDPTDPVLVGELELPGRLQDSRRRGDLIYVVTHEDGCWGCGAGPNTTITSFDISDLSELRMVDQAVFAIDSGDYAGEERSVHSTTERMYVAGPVWGGETEGRSTVSVLDISDPDGALQAGATFRVEGEISSRWQMDEHQGVLRVVSQHPWSAEIEPVIETFTVQSASEIEPLGSAQMQLPRPEQLRSVRFDGDRGYAITFEQTDPLFTLDLSDPVNPRQVGELEIPGWVYHMVPRGDQVVGLGFDRDHPDGALNVSLFDVSDFASPALLSRVHFGGDWADFAESQNRIHKAFALLQDEGLMLVPFSGWDYEDDSCRGVHRAGVQLIDLAEADLSLRGVAEQDDATRRALLHGEALLAVSDRQVRAFDIADRDAPEPLSAVPLAHQVDHIAEVGEHVARFAMSWERGEAVLEVVPADDPDALEPLGRLDVAQVLDVAGKDGVEWECEGFAFGPQAFFSDDRYLYMVYDAYAAEQQLALAVFDLADPSAPELVAELGLPFDLGYASGYRGADAGRGERIVQVGDALVFDEGDVRWRGDEQAPESTASFRIVDLSDPAAPELLDPIERPDAASHGALRVMGESVVSYSVRAVAGSQSQAAFFLEVLDLSGDAPQASAPVNVPGEVVALDAESARAVVVAPEFEVLADLEWDECSAEPGAMSYDGEARTCVIVHRRLELVQLDGDRASVLDELEIESERVIRDVIATRQQVFALLGRSDYLGYDDVDVDWAVGAGGIGHADLAAPQGEIVAVTGLQDGTLEEAFRVEVNAARLDGIDGSGQRLLVPADDAGLGVLDLSDPSDPAYEVRDLYGVCRSLALGEDVAYCALGERGAQSIPLN